jgi:hypothetical protein
VQPFIFTRACHTVHILGLRRLKSAKKKDVQKNEGRPSRLLRDVEGKSKFLRDISSIFEGRFSILEGMVGAIFSPSTWNF